MSPPPKSPRGYEAEIREAKRIMEAEAAADSSARGGGTEGRGGDHAEDGPHAAEVKPDAPKELPRADRLPQRDFYALMRRARRRYRRVDEPEGEVRGDGPGKDGRPDAQCSASSSPRRSPDAAKELRHFEVLAMPAETPSGSRTKPSRWKSSGRPERSQRAFKAARFRASATPGPPRTRFPARARARRRRSRPEGSRRAQQTLARIDDALEREQIPPRALFKPDGDRDGKLDAGELKDMLWRLLPGLEADEVWLMMATCSSTPRRGPVPRRRRRTCRAQRAPRARRGPSRPRRSTTPSPRSEAPPRNKRSNRTNKSRLFGFG